MGISRLCDLASGATLCQGRPMKPAGPGFALVLAMCCWMFSSRVAYGSVRELGEVEGQLVSTASSAEQSGDGDSTYNPDTVDSNTPQAKEAGEKQSKAMEEATKKAEADHEAAFKAQEAREMAALAAQAKARKDAAAQEQAAKEAHLKRQPPTNEDPTIHNPWALPEERKQPETTKDDEAPKEATAQDAQRVSRGWNTMYERQAKSHAHSAYLNERGIAEVSEV